MRTYNKLLAALPAATFRRLSPHLVSVTLAVGEHLYPTAGTMRFAYFPIDCIVTLSYAIGARTMAKAWPVGREGMVGISLLLGGSQSRYNHAEVQFGGTALRIPAAALLAEFRRAGALQSLLLRYVFALITQASQLGVCNLYHSADQRLCRFLSRGFDRVNGKDLVITQSRIAALLGLRREAITEIALHLQEAGVIEYFRGRITLMDRRALEKRACSCDKIIRGAFAAVS
jgi:Crp-like helix-turn-helix protein